MPNVTFRRHADSILQLPDQSIGRLHPDRTVRSLDHAGCAAAVDDGDPGAASALLLHGRDLYEDRAQRRRVSVLPRSGGAEDGQHLRSVDRGNLERHSEGLIVLSGGVKSDLTYWLSEADEDQLAASVDWFQKRFGEDYYFELQDHQLTIASYIFLSILKVFQGEDC